MRIKSIPLLLAGTALAASGIARADTLDDRWYLAPGLSYIIADDDRDADDDMGFSLGLGKPVSEHWNIELNTVGDTLDASNTSGEFKQRGIGLDGLFFLYRERGFAPYLAIGAGALRTKYLGDTATHATANAGVGFLSTFGDHGVGVRADARYRVDNDGDSVADEDRFGDWLINLGLVVPLGQRAQMAAAPAPVPVAAPAPKDSDGDGVIDAQDRCPGTPPGAKVDAQGCELDSDGDGVKDSADQCPDTAAGAQVDARGCEMKKDSDNDGVTDDQDRCPDTPAGTKVDAQGCEPDSDGDGVKDSADQCPDTAAGVKVDTKGCALPEVIRLEGVKFGNNSAELTAESKTVLNDAAATLKRNADLTVEVAGHTDNRGNRARNVRLSQKRAESVMNYLVSAGVPAANLSAKGYGPDHPVSGNDTAEGRAVNRRVELRILNN